MRLLLTSLFACLLFTAVALAYPPATVTVTQGSVTVGNLDCGTQYRVTVEEQRSGAWRDLQTYTPTTAACPAPPQPPVANFTIAPDRAVRAQPTTFTSTATCPDAPCSLVWLHGDASSTDQIGTGSSASFTYTGPAGTRTVTLRATDAGGQVDTETKTFQLVEPDQPPPPPATPPSGGFPDASNTGVPPGTVLTPSGGLTITQAGAVIDRLTISGCVVVQAPNVTIRRSRIQGSCFWLVNNNSTASTNLVIEDSEIDGLNSSCTAVGSSDFTVRRTDIRGCENGFNVSQNGNVLVEDSYIHHLTSTAHNPDAHSDGAQFGGGTPNITFRHNTIQPIPPGWPGTGTSAIIMWDGDGAQNSNVLIDNNRLLGRETAWTLYCPRQASVNTRITNNRFERAVFGHAAWCRPGQTITAFSGNVDDTTGAPVGG